MDCSNWWRKMSADAECVACIEILVVDSPAAEESCCTASGTLTMLFNLWYPILWSTGDTILYEVRMVPYVDIDSAWIDMVYGDWKSLISYTSPTLLRDCSNCWWKLSADAECVACVEILVVDSPAAEESWRHLSDVVSCWQSSDRGYSWLDDVGFWQFLSVRARSGAVWGGMSYRHFIFCKINIPELFCLETPYRYELFECFKSHNLYYCWNNTTQNNRVINYFHQQHCLCLVYITISVSCKYLILWTSSGQCYTSTADAPIFSKLTDASFTSFQPCFMEEVRSETSHLVSAEVLFTWPSAHVHPRGVPRWVVPVHLHRVQCFPATRSAPWITEGSHRHSDPQETRSRSGQFQELPTDL